MEFTRRPAAALFCLLPFFASLPAAAQSKGDAKKTEEQIAQLNLSLTFDPGSLQQYADSIVQRLEIEPPAIEIAGDPRRLTLADGSPADYLAFDVDFAGQAPFSKVYEYLNDLFSFNTNGVKLGELHLAAQPGNRVEFRARYTAVQPTLAVVPIPKKPTPESLERRRLTLQLLEEVVKDTQSRGLFDSLGFLAEELKGAAVGITSVDLKDGQGQIAGAALGPTAAAAFTTALEASGLASAKAEFQTTARPCRPFKVVFTPGGQAPEDAYSYMPYNGLFDAAIPALCAAPAAAKEIKVAGKAGAAGIELDLRDVALLDALAILSDLTREGFLAEPGLPELRISLAARGAGAQELVASLEAAGIEVAPGNPHWVVKAGGKAPALPKGGTASGEEVYFNQRAGSLKDLACKVSDYTSKAIWSAVPLDAQLTAFVSGMPWDQALGAALAPHGLVAAEAGERIVIGPGPAAELAGREDLQDVCAQEYTGEPASTGSRLADMEFSEGTLKLEDFELAGLGKKDGDYFGVVFWPNRQHPVIASGSSWIGDGTVTVSQTGLTLEREDGSKGILKWPPAGK